MVVKRTCSFCAGEIEPGTGAMFVKRDGTVFHFCSSSCRKQQLHLGRVGHRLKWTRAHALKRAAEQAAPKASASGVLAAPRRRSGQRKAGPPPTSPAPAAPVAPEPAAAPAPAPETPAPAKRAKASNTPKSGPA
jgi:large subunit ribosomal protein L24e